VYLLVYVIVYAAISILWENGRFDRVEMALRGKVNPRFYRDVKLPIVTMFFNEDVR